jgi:hypothetical protein
LGFGPDADAAIDNTPRKAASFSSVDTVERGTRWVIGGPAAVVQRPGKLAMPKSKAVVYLVPAGVRAREGSEERPDAAR